MTKAKKIVFSAISILLIVLASLILFACDDGEYKITANSGKNGEIVLFDEKAKENDKVYFMATAEEGYQISDLVFLPEIEYTQESNDVFSFVMPSQDVSIVATFREKAQVQKFDIIMEKAQNGEVLATKSSAQFGETVEIFVSPAAGYQIDQLTINPNGVVLTQNSTSRYTFSMPAQQVTISATFKAVEIVEGGYSVTASANNGKILVSPSPAKAGDKIEVMLSPNEDYVLDSIIAQPQVELTKINENAYSFIMPEEDVRIEASFKLQAAESFVEGGYALSYTERNYGYDDPSVIYDDIQVNDNEDDIWRHNYLLFKDGKVTIITYLNYMGNLPSDIYKLEASYQIGDDNVISTTFDFSNYGFDITNIKYSIGANGLPKISLNLEVNDGRYIDYYEFTKQADLPIDTGAYDGTYTHNDQAITISEGKITYFNNGQNLQVDTLIGNTAIIWVGDSQVQIVRFAFSQDKNHIGIAGRIYYVEENNFEKIYEITFKKQ